MQTSLDYRNTKAKKYEPFIEGLSLSEEDEEQWIEIDDENLVIARHS